MSLHCWIIGKSWINKNSKKKLVKCKYIICHISIHVYSFIYERVWKFSNNCIIDKITGSTKARHSCRARAVFNLLLLVFASPFCLLPTSCQSFVIGRVHERTVISWEEIFFVPLEIGYWRSQSLNCVSKLKVIHFY